MNSTVMRNFPMWSTPWNVPAYAIAAPPNPPSSAWEELVGSP
jgi:hypothetical protein